MVRTQVYTITKQQREEKHKHRSFVIWFTGLSGSGKSTMADLLEQHLFAAGHSVYVLDGDNIRNGINKDLGFSKEDRKENIRRVAEIARLFCDAGIITITAFISPYKEDRLLARDIIGSEHFVEVYIDAPLDTCIDRDIKGLYAKAKEGIVKNFTGVSDVYEKPEAADIVLHTANETPAISLEKLVLWLNNNYLQP